MRAIIDTDVLIDFLQGADKAKRELDRYAQREISIVSWMELLIGADTPEEEKDCREFLSSCTIHQLSVDIASAAVQLRKQFRLRLPDAIVWATARTNSCLLVTRNSKHFSATEPGVRIPYSLP
jgi:predicted nucleic acid-binding protein